MDITVEALKLRRRELEIDKALIQGALDEISHIIGEMERRRGGRPRKSENISIIPGRVAGGSAETETDEQGPLPSLDEVRGILKEAAQ